jgi:methionine synthase II (cobalamin-independent)
LRSIVVQESLFGDLAPEENSSMTANTRVEVARADVVGSLLRPAYLRDVRQEVSAGRASAAALRAAEDRAVLEAVTLQEAVGLQVLSDGEMRREGWNAPLRAALSGFTSHRRELRHLNDDNSDQHSNSCRMVSLPHDTL